MGPLERINSGEVSALAAQSYLSANADQISSAKPQAAGILTKTSDTLEFEEETTDTQKQGVFSRLVSWFSSWISSDTDTVKADAEKSLNPSDSIVGVGQRPVLEAPEYKTNKSIRMHIDEMNHLIHRIKDMSEDTDTILDFEKILKQIYLKQLSLKEAETMLHQLEATSKHQERKGFSKETLVKMAEMADRNGKATILTWVERGAVCAGVVLLGAAFVASAFFTGGGTVVIGALAAGAGVIGGGAKVGQGYFAKQDGNDSAELLQLNEKMTVNDKAIKDRMKGIEECIKAISNFYAQLRQSNENHSEAILEIIKGIK